MAIILGAATRLPVLESLKLLWYGEWLRSIRQNVSAHKAGARVHIFCDDMFCRLVLPTEPGGAGYGLRIFCKRWQFKPAESVIYALKNGCTVQISTVWSFFVAKYPEKYVIPKAYFALWCISPDCLHFHGQ